MATRRELIRDMQQELAAVGDRHGQPPARGTDDLSAFLDGLGTTWQNVDRPPQGGRRQPPNTGGDPELTHSKVGCRRNLMSLRRR